MQYIYPGAPFAMANPSLYTGMYPHGAVAMPPGYAMAHAHMQSAPAAHIMRAGPSATYVQGLPVAYGDMQAVADPAYVGAMASGRFHSPWRVVVHNLPWEVDNDELLNAFSDWNPIAANVVKDYRTGYSKCAFELIRGFFNACHTRYKPDR